MLFAIAAPADNDRGPRYMQEALAAIHQSLRRGRSLRLVYGCFGGEVSLCVEVDADLRELVAGAITARYPNCELHEVAGGGGELCFGSDDRVFSANLVLVPDLFPILRHMQFEDILQHSFADPIGGILRWVKPDALQARVDITIRPANRRLSRHARSAVRRLDRPFFRTHRRLAGFYARMILRRSLWPLAWLLGLAAGRGEHGGASRDVETTGGRYHEREADLQAASDKVGGHLFETEIRLMVSAPRGAEREAKERIRALAGAFGAFTLSRLATFHTSRVWRSDGRGDLPGRAFLASHEELASLFHPPAATVGAERLHVSSFRELEAPTLLPTGREDGAVVVGRVRFRSDDRTFGIMAEDRARHVYIAGKTGMGKTSLLCNLVRADIAAGRGVGLIDPHGDLAAAVIGSIPRERTNDVVVFDPADREYAVAYNPLACEDAERRDLVVDDVLSAFSKVYDLSQTPRLKDTLRNALYVLVEQGRTLVDLLWLLSDVRFRARVTSRIEDDIARLFWQTEFPSWNERYRAEALSAIQNKVRPFLMSRPMRAIVGQTGPSLNLREVMDEGAVLIANLSKGRLGEENARLLGALLVTGIQQAAMRRADILEILRLPWYLYVDEFQNFTTGSFATILSEARKYRAPLLTLAHQYLRQLDDATRDAVFGNVGSMVCFQVGSEDARVLAEQLAKFPGQVQPQDLTNVPKYTAYVRLLTDGLPSNPFSMTTIPPSVQREDRTAAVCQASRRRYARPAAKVHEELRRELVSA